MSSDKVRHFAVTFGITLTVHSLVSSYAPNLDPNVVSFGAAVSIGALKEGVDALGFGTPDWADMLCNVLGALAGVAFSLVIQGF